MSAKEEEKEDTPLGPPRGLPPNPIAAFAGEEDPDLYPGAHELLPLWGMPEALIKGFQAWWDPQCGNEHLQWWRDLRKNQRNHLHQSWLASGKSLEPFEELYRTQRRGHAPGEVGTLAWVKDRVGAIAAQRARASKPQAKPLALEPWHCGTQDHPDATPCTEPIHSRCRHCRATLCQSHQRSHRCTHLPKGSDPRKAFRAVEIGALRRFKARLYHAEASRSAPLRRSAL